MPQLPYIELLMTHYPQGTVQAVANLIGGTVGKNLLNPKYSSYKDSCCLRVCRALNYSGDPVPAQGGGIAGVRTDSGGDKKHYIYSTYDIRKYLNGRYGLAKKFPANTSAEDVKEYYGIIAFGYAHIDLWNSTKAAHMALFNQPGSVYDGIYIWETFSLLSSFE